MLVILVTGSLGAGKTTLVNQLLASKVVDLDRSVYIATEVGDVNVDVHRVSIQNKLALTSGSICCNDIDSLVRALSFVRSDRNKRWVFVEPSGIAPPDDIILTLERECIDYIHLRVVNMGADPVTSEQRYVEREITSRQQTSRPGHPAQSVFLTRCPQETVDLLRKHKSTIPTLFPLDPDHPLSVEELKTLFSDNIDANSTVGRKKYSEQTRANLPRFTQSQIILNVYVRPDQSDEFLAEIRMLVEQRQIFRLKGYVDQLEVDVVGREIRIKNLVEAPAEGISGVFVIIGSPNLATSDLLAKWVRAYEQAKIRQEIIQLLSTEHSNCLTADGKVIVDNPCDRAYSLAVQLDDQRAMNTYLAAVAYRMAEWRLQCLDYISQINESRIKRSQIKESQAGSSVSDTELDFWQHSLAATIGWFIIADRHALGDHLLLRGLNSHPFATYFRTMKLLKDSSFIREQGWNYVPPFLTNLNRWDFWVAMVMGGDEFGEMTISEAVEIIRTSVTVPKEEEQEAEDFFALFNH